MCEQNSSKQGSAVVQFLDDHPGVETVEVVLTDLNGVYRGKWLPAATLPKVLEGTFIMPLTAVSPDIWVVTYRHCAK